MATYTPYASMKNAGLSQDEAALLIRLHGPKAR
jgi:hypothetical protein